MIGRSLVFAAVTTHVVAFPVAARRTADGSPEAALRALLGAAAPADIAQGKAPGVAHLQECRDAVNAEIGRCARMPPKFSADGVPHGLPW